MLNVRFSNNFAQLKTILGSAAENISENSPFILSDADEQMIIKVGFVHPVTITAVRPTTPHDPIFQVSFKADLPPKIDPEVTTSPPSSVKFYANKDQFDFSEVDSTLPDQECKFNPDEWYDDRAANKLSNQGG